MILLAIRCVFIKRSFSLGERGCTRSRDASLIRERPRAVRKKCHIIKTLISQRRIIHRSNISLASSTTIVHLCVEQMKMIL